MTLTRRAFTKALVWLAPLAAGLGALKSKAPSLSWSGRVHPEDDLMVKMWSKKLADEVNSPSLMGRLVYTNQGESEPQIVRWSVPAGASDEVEIAKIPPGATLLRVETFTVDPDAKISFSVST